MGECFLELDFEEIENSGQNPYAEKLEAFFGSVYRKNVERLVGEYPENRSLLVDFKELEKFDFQLADDLIDNPDYVIEAAKTALLRIDVPALEIEKFEPHIRFFNLPKDRKFLIRDISADHLGKMIAVEGIIRQITDVLPKLKTAAWQCRRCGNVYKKEQGLHKVVTPAVCQCKQRDFELLAEQSIFIDYQKIEIQESLENIKGNEQAQNITIYVSNDMVNRVTAGDRTLFVGMLRLSHPDDKKTIYGRFLDATYLEETQKEFMEVEVSPEEEKEIRELAKDPKIYDKLIASLAPGIYGHEVVKEAIVMQLFGGVKKVLPGQHQIRGNIHVLLVGDPGAAKSTILLATNRIAPKSIYVAGKTATGAGLSATAVKDEFGEGGWTLKAGVLVLASGGLAAVDEFDKMETEDRSAMHEALEQQQISVAKAGIVTRFKSDTSVLAAANPKFARFDPYQPFISQIDLPATLISRFDLFFMIRDVLDRQRDEEITAHILKTHHAGEAILQAKSKGEALAKSEMDEIEKVSTPPISGELFKKFVSYARQTMFPVLSKDAIEMISEFYVNLRSEGKKDGSYTATHRQLEGLVRLSEASAKIRLSDTVDKEDAARAIRLVRTSLENVVTDPETGKIDIDIITSGQTHTKLTNMKKILQIIKEKSVDLDMVPIDDIVMEAETQGIGKEKAMDIISELDKKGEIYKPRHHFVKPTQKS